MIRYPFDQDIAAAAKRAAAEFRVPLPAHLLGALVCVESGYKPNAYRFEPGFWRDYLADNPRWNTRGIAPERLAASYGLTQILYVVADENGFTYAEPEYLYVPSINLDAGARHLAKLVAWADNDHEKALAAYNGGKGATRVKPYKTAAYAARVLDQWRALEPPP